MHAVVLLVRACVETKVAQASASGHSGGTARRQSTPPAAPSVGQPRPISRLGPCWHPDHVGLGFDLVCAQSLPMKPASHLQLKTDGPPLVAALLSWHLPCAEQGGVPKHPLALR